MRKCLDCGKSLKGRGNNVKRCESCQEKHRSKYKVEKNKNTKIEKEVHQEHKKFNRGYLDYLLALSDDELREHWEHYQEQWRNNDLSMEERMLYHSGTYVITAIERKKAKQRKIRRSYLNRLYREADIETLGKIKKMESIPDFGSTICISENKLDEIRKRKYGKTDKDEQEFEDE